MRPSEALAGNEERVRKLVEEFGYKNPLVYGSTARGEDGEQSDLDILVEPAKDGLTIFDRLELQGRLEILLKVPVDVKTDGWIADRGMRKVRAEGKPL